MSVDFAVTGQQGMDSFTGGSVIMDSGLFWWFKQLNNIFVSYKHMVFHFTRG